MNAYLNGLVHGTHHVAQQIACALGLSVGLNNIVNAVNVTKDVPKSAKQLLNNFAGKPKARRNNLKNAISNCGALIGRYLYLKEDHVLFECVQNWCAAAGYHIEHSRELQFYKRYESNEKHMYHSKLYRENIKVDSTVIEYISSLGTLEYYSSLLAK